MLFLLLVVLVEALVVVRVVAVAVVVLGLVPFFFLDITVELLSRHTAKIEQ